MDYAAHVAPLNGLTFAQTDYLVRHLRKADLLPATKRGFGASEMTAEGAVNLLLAVMTGAPPSDAASAVEVYRSLRPMRCSLPHKAVFHAIGQAVEAPTFGEALAVLVERAPALKRAATTMLALAYGKLPPEQLTEGSLDLLFSLELTISRPVPHARLTLRSPNDLGFEVIEFEHQWVMDVNLMNADFYAEQFKEQRDMRTETTINHKVLFRLGDLLRADDTEEQDDAETSRVERDPQPEGGGDAEPAAEGGTGKPRSIGWRESGLRLS
jgi:hypothetical protein